MPLAFLNALDIHFALVNKAPVECIPQPYNLIKNSYRLKSRISCCLGYDTVKAIPTGIQIEDFPEFTLNPGSSAAINMYTVARCVSDEELLIEYGVRTLGPDIIDKYYHAERQEVTVLLHNTSHDLFYIDAGDEISIITFELKPLVEFTINPNTLTIPRE